MKTASTCAELSLPHDNASRLAGLSDIVYDADFYTPEPDFNPDSDIAIATVPALRPEYRVRPRTCPASPIADLLAVPRTRQEALAALRHTLGDLSMEMRSASAMPAREMPQTSPFGIASLDAATGGLPIGALTEIHGPASSGRTSLLIAALAAATSRGETCALIDTTDNFSPHTSARAGVALSRLLWVRCNGIQSVRENPGCEKNAHRFAANDFGGHDLLPRLAFPPSAAKLARSAAFRRLEQALKITDLLIQAGGLGLIALDTAGLPAEVTRRVPLTSWFRFRRAIEHTPTVLLAVGQEPVAQSCASLVLRLERLPAQHAGTAANLNSAAPTFTTLLYSLDVAVEIERAPQPSSCGKKKPPRSAIAQFSSTAAWG